MLKTIAVAGAVAAVIVGAGTTALAVSGDSQTTGGHAAATSPAKADPAKNTKKSKNGKQHALRKALLRAAHAEIVTKGKDGFVEHDAIRGQVVSVSATSISVKAADGYGKTFVVGTSTHVRKRVTTGGKVEGTPGKITDVKAGDQVVVLGKHAASATANPTATVVIDGVRKQK